VDDVFEARRISKSAPPASPPSAPRDQLATLAMKSPACSPRSTMAGILVHDINFHRGVAAASASDLGSLVEMVAALFYDSAHDAERRPSIATPRRRDAHRTSTRRSRQGCGPRPALMNDTPAARSYQAKE